MKEQPHSYFAFLWKFNMILLHLKKISIESLSGLNRKQDKMWE